MVQRIDNSDKHYTPYCYTEIKTLELNEKNPVESFVKEFFYDQMILEDHHKQLKKGLTIIKDGANDIKDELCDFSRDNSETTFILRFINKKDHKVREEYSILNGEIKKIHSVKPKHNPEKQDNKPKKVFVKSHKPQRKSTQPNQDQNKAQADT